MWPFAVSKRPNPQNEKRPNPQNEKRPNKG